MLQHHQLNTTQFIKKTLFILLQFSHCIIFAVIVYDLIIKIITSVTKGSLLTNYYIVALPVASLNILATKLTHEFFAYYSLHVDIQ